MRRRDVGRDAAPAAGALRKLRAREAEGQFGRLCPERRKAGLNAARPTLRWGRASALDAGRVAPDRRQARRPSVRNRRAGRREAGILN